MKVLIPFCALSILVSTNALANNQSVTGDGVDRDVTINRLMSKVPRGATVTDSSCEEIGTGGFNTRYRCTVKWR